MGLNLKTNGVFLHTIKCQRKNNGSCSFCVHTSLGEYEMYIEANKMYKKPMYAWVGSTGCKSEWLDKTADVFGKFHPREVIKENLYGTPI